MRSGLQMQARKLCAYLTQKQGNSQRGETLVSGSIARPRAFSLLATGWVAPYPTGAKIRRIGMFLTSRSIQFRLFDFAVILRVRMFEIAQSLCLTDARLVPIA